jgi:hypothetical protein
MAAKFYRDDGVVLGTLWENAELHDASYTHLGKAHDPVRVVRVGVAFTYTYGRHAVLVFVDQTARHEVAVANGLHLRVKGGGGRPKDE